MPRKRFDRCRSSAIGELREVADLPAELVAAAGREASGPVQLGCGEKAGCGGYFGKLQHQCKPLWRKRLGRSSGSGRLGGKALNRRFWPIWS